MPYEHDQDDMQVHMPFLEECAARAGVIVEIGVGHGNGSTRAFARGLERSPRPSNHKLHVGVDWDPERPQIKPNHPWWIEVHGASENPDTAQTVLLILDEHAVGPHADIIFIDTIHTYEQMYIELPIWGNLAGPETLWVFHDTNMWQVFNHMTVAIQEFAHVNDWEFLEYALESHGLGVMRKSGGVWADIQPREVRPSA